MNSFVVAVLLAVFSWTSHNAGSITGTIEGQVTVRQLKQRVANRYPGGAAGASHDVKPLPIVAYIEGKVAGSAFNGPENPIMAQRDTSFQPGMLIIPVGTSVRFPNEDKFFHNVFSYSKPKRFDLGRYPRGEAKTVTFDEPGTITVFCEIHKWMRAAIIVVENGFHDTVGDDGKFRIPNVPAGNYKLVFWHPERGRKVVDVAVPSSGAVRVDAAF